MKRVLICLLVVAGALPSTRLTATATANTPAPEPLRADLQALRPMYTPEGPLRLRFTLINTADAPTSIPVTNERPEGGIALPRELIVGTPDAAAITVWFDDEQPQTLAVARRTDDTPPPMRELVLAPHGALGTEFDLRSAYQGARYPGSYRIEWRPLGERVPPAVVEFRVEPRKDVIMVTDHGKLHFTLEYAAAPRNVENFLELIRDGFYDGKTFHRVIPGFVVQGGCPKGDGSGTRPDGKLVRAEFSDIPVDTGTLVMARKPSDPHSASCQFFIALDRLEDLDEKYTVIGQAHGKRTLDTLKKLASVATDRRDQPIDPLRIRSVNLVDAEADFHRPRRIEYHGNRSGDQELLRGRRMGE